MSQYQFDHEWKKERERLANMEAVFDPMETECLDKTGVSEGWNCLEIGAGGGSIVEWLSERVGSTGKVVGTDLQTKFLQAIDAPNVEIRQHNILTDNLEQDAFDLVCARKVLEHLADPTPTLQKTAAAVRPEGWLLVEDGDMASFRRVTTPNPELFERVYTAFLETMKLAGFNPYQFTQQATPFREFAEMPGHPREMVLAATDIKPDDTVLDVACGPGVTTCDLAAVAQHATGIDITPAMIEQAKKLQQDKGLTNVAWHVDAVPPLPFYDETFSLVFTRYSLHHFPDPLAVLKEMVRVCKAGGRIVVVDVFMTRPQQADAYNRMEKLRDPSHFRALLLDELTELFGHVGLCAPKAVFYKQPMSLEPLLKRSFPNPGDEDRVRQIIVDDVGKDELGLGAQWKDADVHFAFSIAVLACAKE